MHSTPTKARDIKQKFLRGNFAAPGGIWSQEPHNPGPLLMRELTMERKHPQLEEMLVPV